MILGKGLRCNGEDFLTVVSFRILTALPCLVTVSVACFCVFAPPSVSLARKKREKKYPTFHFLHFLSSFQYSLVSSEPFSDTTGNNSVCDTGNNISPRFLWCVCWIHSVWCYCPYLSPLTSPLFFLSPRNICNLEYKQVTAAVIHCQFLKIVMLLISKHVKFFLCNLCSLWYWSKYCLHSDAKEEKKSILE